MTEAMRGRSSDSSRYEIRIGGRLAPRWDTWFDGMTLTTAADGTTVLSGPVADQAGLHGWHGSVIWVCPWSRSPGSTPNGHIRSPDPLEPVTPSRSPP